MIHPTHNERLMLGIAPHWEGDSIEESLHWRAVDEHRSYLLENPIAPRQTTPHMTNEEFNAWIWATREEFEEKERIARRANA